MLVLMLIATVLFIIYPMVGGMVANIVTQRGGMNGPATFVSLNGIGLGSHGDIHILERYTGVFPLWDYSRLKDNSDACFRGEIIANRTSDGSYNNLLSVLHFHATVRCKYLASEDCSLLQKRQKRKSS
jgi:hypothetical protein